MFGKNIIRKAEFALPGETLAVQEIFETLQGEGPQAGRPCVFIRLAGCNLACTFCDTEFESGINNRMAVDRIAETVEGIRSHALVVLTGGEPMRQNIVPLIARLRSGGLVKLVQIETAGTLWPPGMERFFGASPFVQLVCSPKTPRINPLVAEGCEHFKYVVKADDADYRWGLPVSSTQRPGEVSPVWKPDPTRIRPWTIWVSPCDEQDPEKNAKNLRHATNLCFTYGYRLSLQQHKLIGLP